MKFFLLLFFVRIFILSHADQINTPPDVKVLAPFPMDTALPGVKSLYTDWLISQLKAWPPKSVFDDRFLAPTPDENIQIKCIQTPKNPDYVGLAQSMFISAPFEKVEALIDDIDQYENIFPDFENVSILSKDRNTWHTRWEQIIPIPLVPNIQYDMLYLSNKISPTKKIYRYQLKSPGKITANDGAIVIEKNGSSVRYTEMDFWDANWGIVKTFAPGRIWRDSVKGIFLANIAMKLQAESPVRLEHQVLQNKAKSLWENFPLEKCLDHKISVLGAAPAKNP